MSEYLKKAEILKCYDSDELRLSQIKSDMLAVVTPRGIEISLWRYCPGLGWFEQSPVRSLEDY